MSTQDQRVVARTQRSEVGRTDSGLGLWASRDTVDSRLLIHDLG